MKCEVSLRLLEEYLDGEIAGHEAEQVGAHLITCASCAREFDGLSVEQETYLRYDRALEIAPSMWTAIAAHTSAEPTTDSASLGRLRDRIAGFFATPSLGWSFAGAVAVLLLVAMIGAAYLRIIRQPARPAGIAKLTPKILPGSSTSMTSTKEQGSDKTERAPNDKTERTVNARPKSKSRSLASARQDQSDVLFPEGAYSAIEEQETERHIEQAQNLLRSVRNIEFSEDDTEVDVSYEKALSRRLLNENVVLRRDAEMSGRFPVKTLLSSLEPFLLDIANLPDKTSPADLRVIKERVEQTEIVAALHTY